jgi:hypothetical protein
VVSISKRAQQVAVASLIGAVAGTAITGRRAGALAAR